MQNYYRISKYLTIKTVCWILVSITVYLLTGCITTMDVSDYGTLPPPDSLHTKHQIINNYFVYYGSFHNHSNISDGTGSPDEAYDYAKNSARLDFFGLSDHDYYRTDSNWRLVKSVADRYNADGVFTTFWGFEWTSGCFGHVTVVNADTFCTIMNPETATFQQLCSWLNKKNCFAIFNHPGRQNAYRMEFDHFDSTVCEKFVGMELWNKSEGFSSYYYNDGYDSNDNNKGFYDEALTDGWKIGAAGGFDNHYATWGTSADFRIAILAKNLTREDLNSAMKSRRFFSTLDKNIAISFTVAGQEMGSTIPPGITTLQIQASDGDNEEFSEVVLFDRDHLVRRYWKCNGSAIDITDTLHTNDNDYYYVKVKQVDGEEAISSPVWVSNE
jgi:hypothetical protein